MARVRRHNAPKRSRLGAPFCGSPRASARALARASVLLFALSGAVGGLGVGATSLSCLSPTLPLPPPASPIISSGSAPDTFKLTSLNGAQPNALIIIVNRNESLARDKRVSGTIADESGSWDATVIAKVGDSLDITQESGTASSPATTVTVR